MDTCDCKKLVDENGDSIPHDEADDCIVKCDRDCRALAEPETREEIRAAYIHWRKHSYLHGCSHGH